MKLKGEAQLQAAVVKYIQYNKLLFCASAGGVRVSSMYQAKLMKATGYVKGFPDVFIYEPNKKYYGLAIELKVKGNYATAEQKKWLEQLNKKGYYAICLNNLDEVIDVINKYLNNGL
tara:strand:- start:707 stop:1057 length:351 start_codon:yes stop_codon:yes gene_type:complete